MTRVLRFGVAGLIGFVVDAAVLHSLIAATGLNPYLARLPSFLAAATATWLINRYWAFADRRGDRLLREWLHYLLAMAGGGGVNYGVYSALLLGSELVRAWPVLGVAAGSLAGMVTNYLSSRWLIFRSPRAP